jgi:hypothetical protein
MAPSKSDTEILLGGKVFRVKSVARWLSALVFLTAVFTLALGSVFWPLMGRLGWPVALIASLFFFLGFALFGENALVRFHEARPDLSQGLKGTYQAVHLDIEREDILLRRKQGPFPRIMIFESVSPLIWISRSFRGSGTLVLSTGVVRKLSESELQALIKECVFASRSPELPIRTFFSSLLAFFSALIPSGWRKFFVPFERRGEPSDGMENLSALSALGTLMLFPFYSITRRCSAKTQAERTAGNRAYESALQKISKSLSAYPVRCGSYAGGLYVVDPGSKAMLFGPGKGADK